MTSMMFSIRKVAGVPVGKLQAAPDISLGNALFFDPDPACLIQLRPVMTSDHPLYADNPAIGLLYARGLYPGAPDFVSYVHVPKHLRKNDQAGITHAIECVARFDKGTGVRLRELAARTRWPKPEAWSWTA